ncbi:MAG: hypothetical protein ACPL1F_02310 [bacterium]
MYSIFIKVIREKIKEILEYDTGWTVFYLQRQIEKEDLEKEFVEEKITKEEALEILNEIHYQNPKITIYSEYDFPIIEIEYKDPDFGSYYKLTIYLNLSTDIFKII